MEVEEIIQLGSSMRPQIVFHKQIRERRIEILVQPELIDVFCEAVTSNFKEKKCYWWWSERPYSTGFAIWAGEISALQSRDNSQPRIESVLNRILCIVVLEHMLWLPNYWVKFGAHSKIITKDIPIVEISVHPKPNQFEWLPSPERRDWYLELYE